MVKDHNHFAHGNSNDANKKEFSYNLENVNAYREKRTVALASVIASVGLAATKLVIGYSTNSLGILSEAMHSGLDVIAALMTLYAIRIVVRPPDVRFTYGYAKVESLSSLIEIILLFAVAGWIFYEGLDRILFTNTQPEITIFSFAIMTISIVIDLWRSKVLYRAAKRYGSQALEADALHFKADMFSSSIVIVGLVFVFVFHIPNADAFTALIIAAMIIYTSLGLGRRTIDVLLDKAPKGVNHLLLESISGLDGVSKAHDIRIRNMGSTISVDLHIEVPRTSTHDRAHKIATNVENRIREVMPNCDVLVHVDAIETSAETLTDRIRLIAAETDGIKNVHSIYLSRIIDPHSKESSRHDAISIETKSHEIETSDSLIHHEFNPNTSSVRLHLYLDLQVNRNLDLKTAHDITESFERRIKAEITQVKDVTTHIEIESTEEADVMGVEKKVSGSYTEKIRNLSMQINGVIDCKDIGIVEVNNEQHITLTIVIKAKEGEDVTSIEEAHKISTYVQEIIIKETGASRVVVHSEPL
ncbi:MAG TPA: cation diffusion facilitator family transporter [Nitrososphaeraceae archaeon]|nr:cation diffusion facilitator family transporter [Nitrososphaeraceae archaeon]